MRFLVTPFVFEISIGTDIRWVNEQLQLRGSTVLSISISFSPLKITTKTKMPANERRRPQPHNVYNVFFLLERMRLIDTLTDASSSESETNKLQKSYDLDGYESLTFPDLPPRYQHLHLPMGWFVPGKNSKRKHTKSSSACE